MDETQPNEPAAEDATVDPLGETRSPDPDRIREAIERDAAAAEAEPEPDEEEPEDDTPEGEPTALQNWQHLTAELVETREITIEQLLDGFGYVVRQAMPFPQSPNHAECPDCEGWGSVFTGSKLPGSEAAPCDRCQGAGYIAKTLLGQPLPEQPQAPPTHIAPAPGPYQDPMTIPPEAGGTGAPGMQWNPQAGRWIYPEAS